MAQIYVSDIVFGTTLHKMVEHFVKHMRSKFKISLVGELASFLVLQVNQTSNGTFISHTKYVKNLVKKFGLESATHHRTPVKTHNTRKNVDQTLQMSMIGSLLYLIVRKLDLL